MPADAEEQHDASQVSLRRSLQRPDAPLVARQLARGHTQGCPATAGRPAPPVAVATGKQGVLVTRPTHSQLPTRFCAAAAPAAALVRPSPWCAVPSLVFRRLRGSRLALRRLVVRLSRPWCDAQARSERHTHGGAGRRQRRASAQTTAGQLLRATSCAWRALRGRACAKGAAVSGAAQKGCASPFRVPELIRRPRAPGRTFRLAAALHGAGHPSSPGGAGAATHSGGGHAELAPMPRQSGWGQERASEGTMAHQALRVTERRWRR